MPRIARKSFGSIFMHNMVQGINREYIFETDIQKKKYIKLMKKYSEKYKILIIAYCIMDNHAHLLTYTDDINNLSLFMKETNSEYAMYYNKTRKRVGYVFRNRYTSKPIYNQKQLFTCIKYIHMNPVKANICNKEQDYIYSSYNDYFKKTNFINSKILNLIFQHSPNYLEEFKSIEYQTIGIEKEKVNLNKVFEEFISSQNLSYNKKNLTEDLIEKFIMYLENNEFEFTKKELAIALGISRTKLYRKLSKINQRGDNANI